MPRAAAKSDGTSIPAKARPTINTGPPTRGSRGRSSIPKRSADAVATGGRHRPGGARDSKHDGVERAGAASDLCAHHTPDAVRARPLAEPSPPAIAYQTVRLPP